MRYIEIIGESLLTEGADLNCRTCGEHLGKATECDNPQYCGTCGDRTPNPHGERNSYAPFANTTRAKNQSAAPTTSAKDAHIASRAAKHSVSKDGTTWALIDNTVYRTNSASGKSEAIGTVRSVKIKQSDGTVHNGFAGRRASGDQRLFYQEKSAVAWVRSIDIRRANAARK